MQVPSSVSEERELTVVNVRLLPKVLSDGLLGGGVLCFRGKPSEDISRAGYQTVEMYPLCWRPCL